MGERRQNPGTVVQQFAIVELLAAHGMERDTLGAKHALGPLPTAATGLEVFVTIMAMTNMPMPVPMPTPTDCA